MGLRKISLFILLFTAVGCSEPESAEVSSEQQYFVNKAKWEANKEQISSYQIVEYRSGMGGYFQLTLVFAADEELPISCESEYRMWIEENPTITDCLPDEGFHRDVEYYFSRLEELITTDEITRAEFDPQYGVPLTITGTYPSPSCADCGAPGFSIEFRVLD